MELAPSKSIFEVILFLFPLELLCAKLLDNSEVEFIGGAELSVGNRAFQEVLSYQGADDQGGVAVRASHCACGDVGFEGGKVGADVAAWADGVLEFGKGDYVLGPVVEGDFQLAFDVDAADFHGLEGVLAFQLACDQLFVVEAFGTEEADHEADGVFVRADKVVVGFEHFPDCLDHAGDTDYCDVPVLFVDHGFLEGGDQGDPPVVAASCLVYQGLAFCDHHGARLEGPGVFGDCYHGVHKAGIQGVC